MNKCEIKSKQLGIPGRTIKLKCIVLCLLHKIKQLVLIFPVTTKEVGEMVGMEVVSKFCPISLQGEQGQQGSCWMVLDWE